MPEPNKDNFTMWKNNAEAITANIPEVERGDVIQELIIAQWQSSGKYDRSKGAETTYYSKVAYNKLIKLIEKATAKKRAHIRVSLEDVQIGVEYKRRITATELIDLAETDTARIVAALIIQDGLTIAEAARRTNSTFYKTKKIMRQIYAAAKEQKIF